MTSERVDVERAVAFEPGLTLQVAYAGVTRAPAFNSAVERVDEGAIALDLARLPNSQLPPQPGEPVLLVVRRGEQMVAFDGRVVAIEEQPPLLVVTPPTEARRAERRGGTRVPAVVAVRSGVWLDPEEGPRPIESASLIDISAGGAQLRTLTAIGAGAVVRFAFALDPAEPAVEVQGMVAGVSSGPRGVAPRAHVEFIGISDEATQQIARFVERYQLKHPQPA